MQVSFDAALAFFLRLPAHLQAPSLHPAYVQADAARDKDLAPVFFVHQREDDFFYHAFHLATVPGTSCRDIQSPYGYGGPVATIDEPAFLAEAWQGYASWCVEQRVLVEFVRFHPLLENWRFFSGESMPDRETVWVDLKSPDLLASYDVRARTAVRKAVKHGLTVEWWAAERFGEVFQPLYSATMEGLKASSFYFFPQEYFNRLAGWGGARYAACLHEGAVVAAAIFMQGPDVMEYHLSASDGAGKKLGATNLLLHEAGLYGQMAGCGKLHLGGGTDADAANSLLFFKSGFSTRRAVFRIGKNIHDPAMYQAMKAEWQQRTGRSSSRIMFYREN